MSGRENNVNNAELAEQLGRIADALEGMTDALEEFRQEMTQLLRANQETLIREIRQVHSQPPNMQPLQREAENNHTILWRRVLPFIKNLVKSFK